MWQQQFAIACFGSTLESPLQQMTERQRYIEMCRNKRNRVRCKKRFRLTITKASVISQDSQSHIHLDEETRYVPLLDDV